MGCVWTFKSHLWKEQVGSVLIAKCARTASKWDLQDMEEDGVRFMWFWNAYFIKCLGFFSKKCRLFALLTCYDAVLSSWAIPCIGNFVLTEMSWNSCVFYPQSYHYLVRFCKAVKLSDIFPPFIQEDSSQVYQVNNFNVVPLQSENLCFYSADSSVVPVPTHWPGLLH